ncbi:hypothetical protein LTR28_009990 [Elasticomyces elasticus]|nr:hypothetical protein LTR28_009990 [Elasticomyces elasticus]
MYESGMTFELTDDKTGAGSSRMVSVLSMGEATASSGSSDKPRKAFMMAGEGGMRWPDSDSRARQRAAGSEQRATETEQKEELWGEEEVEEEEVGWMGWMMDGG